ncbi:MAG TPA: PfkB family carbohydrate kinase, partial [Gaiellaceae bacterium]|nr:PfkB family carbohydrate kinase [Gaiellaceae bacterium]
VDDEDARARAGVDAFAGARVLVVDAEEARALTGSAPEEAARQLASRHELACVTLGAAGAVLAGPGDASLRRAAPPPELVLKQHKLRGAGDAFAAVLLVELARGAEPEAALAAACAAGASVDAL